MGYIAPKSLVRWSLALLLCLPISAAAENTPAVQLYRQLGSVGLDAARTYHVRDLDLDLEDIHLSLEDGTLSFTQAVDGHVTGAAFEGTGELLIIPPDQAERASLALFTGAAVLEEKFSDAYLRFDDSVAATLAASVRPEPDAQAFVARWDPLAKSLAAVDALRLLLALTNAPPDGEKRRLFHARITGLRLGTFDVLLDSGLEEQISVAQSGYTERGALYYDVWMSFPMRSVRNSNKSPQDPLTLPSYKLRVHVQPNEQLETESQVAVRANRDGLRTLVFELSRYLKIKQVTLAGAPVEFIQNEAIPGSELSRRGNDVMAVVLPQPLHANQEIELNFTYTGSVISDLGNGLMYVGARGSWYPNRGPAMANFDMQFRYPASLSLVATGKRTALAQENGEQLAHWASEGPIPLAGFNLGGFKLASAKAQNVEISSYSVPPPRLAADAGGLSAAIPPPGEFSRHRPLPVLPPAGPLRSVQLRPIEQRAAETINFLTPLWGAYPYSLLSLTPFPSQNSQGWPTLIYLSNFCFLPDSARPQVPADDAAYFRLLYDELMPAHEIAHQWWGDNVLWTTYHDQWLMESLANYSALLEIAAHSPQEFSSTMQRYRDDLLRPAGSKGKAYTEAGPVTLGVRLASSKFPEGYERVLYERGAWLMHMLRAVLSAPATENEIAKPDEAFIRALRELQKQYTDKTLSTKQFQTTLEAYLPLDARYERKPSLDWFFQSWVNGDSVPKIELRDLHLDPRKRIATGMLAQSEAANDLVTLVPIYGVVATSREPIPLGRIFADGSDTTFHLKIPAGTTRLLLDPYNTILRRP